MANQIFELDLTSVTNLAVKGTTGTYVTLPTSTDNMNLFWVSISGSPVGLAQGVTGLSTGNAQFAAGVWAQPMSFPAGANIYGNCATGVSAMVSFTRCIPNYSDE